MSTNKYTQAKVDKTSEVIAALIVVPLLLTACWNYGLTDLIQNLGGPNADVNVIQGALSVYGITGLAKLATGKGL